MNIQKNIFKSFGNSTQTNEVRSFYNVQLNMFKDGGTAIQDCEDGSAGNVQINIGVLGKQITGFTFSHNLQLNVIKCTEGQEDEGKFNKGNYWIKKCYRKSLEDAHFEYKGVVMNYTITFAKDCSGNVFEVDYHGNILYKFCFDYYKIPGMNGKRLSPKRLKATRRTPAYIPLITRR